MEEPLRIAICEDSQSDEEILLTALMQMSTPVAPTVFRCGEDLLTAYHPLEYDLILSDIYMTGMTGVEMIREIRKVDQEIPVAFITSSTDHALESYRLSALMYIEKPYQREQIESMVQLAKISRDSSHCILVPDGNTTIHVRLIRIVFLEQTNHLLNLYLTDGTVLSKYEKLNSLLPVLEKSGFFCPHKSYAVNLAQVRSIDAEIRCFIMSDGQKVPIRRESLPAAKRALQEHLFRSVRGKL